MIPIEYQEMYISAFSIGSFLFGMLTRKWLDTWLTAKKKIHDIRVLAEAVDDAVLDDEVSEEEFREVWNAAKAVIQK